MDTLVYLKKPLKKQSQSSPSKQRLRVNTPIPMVTGVSITLAEPRPEISFVKLYNDCIGGCSPKTVRDVSHPIDCKVTYNKSLTKQESNESIVTCYDCEIIENDYNKEMSLAVRSKVTTTTPTVDLLYEFNYDTNNDDFFQNYTLGPLQSEHSCRPFQSKEYELSS